MDIASQRFGETRSGKAICTYTTATTEDTGMVAQLVADFSPSDYFDAMALFQYLAIRALRRAGAASGDLERYEWYYGFYFIRLSSEQIDEQMRGLSLVTSICVVKHGNSGADDLFVD